MRPVEHAPQLLIAVSTRPPAPREHAVEVALRLQHGGHEEALRVGSATAQTEAPRRARATVLPPPGQPTDTVELGGTTRHGRPTQAEDAAWPARRTTLPAGTAPQLVEASSPDLATLTASLPVRPPTDAGGPGSSARLSFGALDARARTRGAYAAPAAPTTPQLRIEV